jgi:hypothetical protein
VITLLLFFVLPVSMTARTLAIVLGVGSLLFLVSQDSQVAHMAHLAGGLAGYAYGRGLARGWNDPVSAGLRRWRYRFKGFRVVGPGPGVERDEPLADAPTAGEVDRILDKISAEGMGSLNRRERAILDRASSRMRR